MKLYAFAAVLAVLLVAGCTAPGTTLQNNTEVIPPNYIYNTGNFKSVVTACTGTTLELMNDGTGTIILNGTSKITSRSGVNTYGKINNQIFLQPGEAGTLQLSLDLYTVTETLFNIETKIGTTRFTTSFECKH